MKVVIAGSRNIPPARGNELVRAAVHAARSLGWEITEVVCGEARGIDTCGRRWAERHLIPIARQRKMPVIGSGRVSVTDKYILDENGEPVPEPDRLKWARWFENAQNRVLAQDRVGGYLVSTIFLGLNHSFLGSGPPVLWETMIFSRTPVFKESAYREFQRRYMSKEEALEGHRKLVQMLTS